MQQNNNFFIVKHSIKIILKSEYSFHIISNLNRVSCPIEREEDCL